MGIVLSFLLEGYPPKSKLNVSDLSALYLLEASESTSSSRAAIFERFGKIANPQCYFSYKLGSRICRSTRTGFEGYFLKDIKKEQREVLQCSHLIFAGHRTHLAYEISVPMDLFLSLLSEACPPKSKFIVKDIPDLDGQIATVTSGNTGVGKETVKALFNHDAKVYLAARSKAKADEAISELKRAKERRPSFCS